MSTMRPPTVLLGSVRIASETLLDMRPCVDPARGLGMTGTIKALYATFGFIAGDDGTDWFFHQSDEADAGNVELVVDDRVSFEPVDPAPAKGPRARDVTLLSAGNHAQEATK